MTLGVKESVLHSSHEAQDKVSCLLKTIEHPALLPFPSLSIQKNSELRESSPSSVIKLTICDDLRWLTFLLQT